MIYQQFLEALLVKVSTVMPDDVCQALKAAQAAEAPDSSAANILGDLSENIRLARCLERPICQDTGTLQVFVTPGNNFKMAEFLNDLTLAVRAVTRRGILRANCVRALTGKNSGDNTGEGSPSVHWLAPSDSDTTSVTILLKGGGSENMSCQYSLPDLRLGAARDAAGVRACVLDALVRIQGQGCAPGILGVAVGGDRAGGYEAAKQLLLRRLGERSEDAALAELETRLLKEANELTIGPMGLGGRTTILDIFIKELTRHPASFFVTIAYNCWCCRRHTDSIQEPR